MCKFLVLIVSVSSFLYSNEYNQMLLDAVNNNDIKQAVEALSNGADANVKDSELGATALFNAITKNDLEMIKLLLGKGANVNVENKYQRAPLHEAILIGDPELVRILLADPQIIVTKNSIGLAQTKCDTYKRQLRTNQRKINFYLGKLNSYTEKINKAQKIMVEESKGKILSERDQKYTLNFNRFKFKVDTYKTLIKQNELCTKKIEQKKNDIYKIGRMLINHLGLYSAQSVISRNGINWIHNLPPELTHTIAAFIN